MSEDVRKNFASDNVTPASAEILEALMRGNQGNVSSYGEDHYTEQLAKKFGEVFETELAVFPIATGTATNSLALSAIVRPYGSVICDHSAHIENDEGGAPEFFTSGAKISTLPSPQGRMSPDALQEAIKRNREKGVLSPPFQALSLTQSTEWGTVYPIKTISALSDIAHQNGLTVHMDGARLGNAINHLNCSPAETTWKAGIDILSFGGTKAGTMAAEALIVFINERTKPFLSAIPHLIKRSGHLWSKHRFLSLQLLALLEDTLWLKNCAHANKMAKLLVAELKRHPGAQMPFDCESNEVFVVLPETLLDNLENEGFSFYRYPTPGGVPGKLVRFVTSFYTRTKDVEALIEAINK
ncbi:threonine aldolase family protein [Aristophania vespae]|uniref:threonine aldolase family protein n=1 Tax=Aristophania vespae TaxID=2697033 RepID=UPI002351B59C|nr:beta-eliminating lyase-related protein [Aristophania vespae]UMM63704.1 Low specificity L-threonine aldolase [Aristophania vespae]